METQDPNYTGLGTSRSDRLGRRRQTERLEQSAHRGQSPEHAKLLSELRRQQTTARGEQFVFGIKQVKQIALANIEFLTIGGNHLGIGQNLILQSCSPVSGRFHGTPGQPHFLGNGPFDAHDLGQILADAFGEFHTDVMTDPAAEQT
ncbi:MAG: hypothetical protein FD153_1593 [Rhodospirillaceae bacterium]|nr:MAG: hypothetical protein FD153_1593 [Rhodospirillaceae bacterium]